MLVAQKTYDIDCWKLTLLDFIGYESMGLKIDNFLNWILVISQSSKK